MHSRGGMYGSIREGGRPWFYSGGRAWFYSGVACMVLFGEACVVLFGGRLWFYSGGSAWFYSAGGHAWFYSAEGGRTWFYSGGGHAWFHLGGCVWFYSGDVRGFIRGGVRGNFSFSGYNDIQSMSGRYASYWNAILFTIDAQTVVPLDKIIQTICLTPSVKELEPFLKHILALKFLKCDDIWKLLWSTFQCIQTVDST